MKKKIIIPIIIFIVLLIVGVSAFLMTRPDSENVEVSNDLVKEAEAFYNSKEYKKAVETFSEALKEYPLNYEAYLGIIDVLLEKGYMDEAKNIAGEGSDRLNGEQSANLFLQIGNKYYDEGNWDKAEEMYKEGGSKQSVFEIKLALAKLNIQKGDIEEAKKQIKSADNKPEVLLFESYLTLNNMNEGSEIINKIDLNDFEDEENKEKVRNLREIYSLDEDELFKVTHLAKEYINSGYPYLAISIFEKYFEDIEEYWDGQFFLGKAYLDYGEADKAIEKLNNAVALDIQDVDMYLVLARAYLAKDNIDQAIEAYKKVVSIMDTSEHGYAVEEYVDVLMKNNMTNSARTVLEELLSEKTYPWIYLLLCNVSYEQKNLTQMSEYFSKLEGESLTSGEERELIRYKLLHAVEDLKDVEKAQELVGKYRGFDEYNAEVYLLEGKIFVYEENNEKALESLNRSVELDLEGTISEAARKILASI